MDTVDDARARLEAPQPPLVMSASARGPDALRPLLLPRIADVYFEATAPWPEDDVDRVHDVRVATRRLRAALAVATPLLGAHAARGARARVEALGDALGARRAADVSQAWVTEEQASTEDLGERMVLARLHALLEVRRQRTGARLHATFPRDRLLGDGAALVALAASAHEGPPLAEGIEAELAKRARAVERALDSMEDPDDDEGHHALRIALKRLRYTCEITGEAWPERVPESGVVDLKAMQDGLGKLHDQVELIELVDGRRARRGVPGSSADAIVERLRAARDRLYEEARHAVAAHGAPLLEAISSSTR